MATTKFSNKEKKQSVKSINKTQDNKFAPNSNSLTVIDPEAIYCDELIHWLLNQKFIGFGHDFKDYDVVVNSEGNILPSLFSIKEQYKIKSIEELSKLISSKKIKNHGINYFAYKKCIPKDVLLKDELMGDLYDKYSYAHFFFLKKYLEVLNNNFTLFISRLNRALHKTVSFPITEENYNKHSIINLQKLVGILENKEEIKICFLIPDLYTADIHHYIPISNFQKLLLTNNTNPPGKVFTTLMFSSKTAEAFGMLLLKLIKEKIKQLQFEANEIKSTDLEGENLTLELTPDNWIQHKPKLDTQQKMKFALQVLGIDSKKNNNENQLSFKVGELMYIFRALQYNGFIAKNIDKFKLAVAFEIMTGKSHLKFNNLFVQAEKKIPDLEKFFETKSSGKAKSDTKSIIKLLIDGLNKTKEELS